MSASTVGDDLEKQIILMEQELLSKRELLNDCREQLNTEISEHAKTKLDLNKYFNENKELQVQLNICLTGTQKLEEENKKIRESFIRLQVHFNAYTKERQQLLDDCYKLEKENNTLKTEVAELEEQLKGVSLFIENYQKRKSKTEALFSQIIDKQEHLSKEQAHLENACKEGLRLIEMLSEETKYQVKYIREAKIGQAKAEEKIIRLLAVISELQAEKENTNNGNIERGDLQYLELWKSHHREMAIRNEELQKANKRLQEELDFIKERLEILTKKC